MIHCSIVCVLLSVTVGVAPVAAGDSYLVRVERALEQARADIPAMLSTADDAAGRLVEGGKLYAGGQPSVISEISGRAGGLMMIRPLGAQELSDKDVVLYFESDEHPLPETLRQSAACLVVFGADTSQPSGHSFSNHATSLGISPALANAVYGWLFTGELVAALTRLDKMPVMYESIGMYDGFARIQEFGGGEIAYHETHGVAPLDAGALANRYIDAMKAMLHRIESTQRRELLQTARRAAEAKRSGKKTIMYSMGHLFPSEIQDTEISTIFGSAAWNAGFRKFVIPEEAYGEGDMLVHIGYQHSPDRLFDRAVPAGACVSYVSVHSNRDYTDNPNVIWIDPMWPWADACVTLEGYDIPILASSGLINGAIAWEVFRLTQAELNKGGAPAVSD
ncbi:MAG: hypothetical protein KJ052_00410 [Candidatus Hydrogenedentes bacterium]|nr:hypothetical protein [Candidatus Hydrogenedentota bacterium]